ncbi:hypothetical protein [Capnocytophaga canis]|uniref:Uncharacterized protein n=1 Tax=Capnocytophaga canis TaxID=1848903 RepID=A0A3A1YFW3_9FLAO|nr:hypothetical protein [Capnocytophaga canis]RIY35114.1 hypothetical protein CKY20_11280 [Capnocytophaga canis]
MLVHIRRKRNLHRLKLGFEKYKSDVRKMHPKADFSNYPLYRYLQKSRLKQKPEYSETAKYFLSNELSFGKEDTMFDSETFNIPKNFSIIDNYSETTLFLKKLFNSLYNQTFEKITIDFEKCEQIDVCASMCMDIILADFIKYHQQCKKDGHRMKITSIKAINDRKYNISKVLFSVGVYKNLKGVNVSFPNLIPFPVVVGNKDNPKKMDKREIDITKTVNYIAECLANLNRKLTNKAESKLFKAIGEIVINAEEHSSTKKRYIIGYFEKIGNKDDDNYGILNLSILNFGKTFYETFKESENMEVVNQMKSLSKKYTTNGLFRTKKFEEETLWTLYALQDGVTRMNDWKRGNGAIRFIESFFELKGNIQTDNVSKMVITSGHTQIIFDGKYNITEQKRNGENFKMMTFNTSGNIEDMPDQKYVKYEENYFPGTIISVKLKMDYENTEILN